MTMVDLLGLDMPGLERIIEELGEKRYHMSAISLSRCLGDADPEVACAAVRALGKIGGFAGLAPLLDARSGAQSIRARVQEHDSLSPLGGSRQDHVVQMQVAMRQVAGMEREQRLQYGLEHRTGLVDVDRPAASDALRERLPIDVFMRQVQPPIELLDVYSLRQGRVIEAVQVVVDGHETPQLAAVIGHVRT